jgi:hypothetical protein
MKWEQWMILQLIEVETYAERVKKMEEFIAFMEVIE